MAFQDSHKTIEKLYEILDFKPGENLAATEVPSDKKYEEALLDSAKKKLGVESIFFYRPPNGGTSIPHIYFRRLEGQNPTEVSRELAEFHKLAWNMGQAPLLFAVLPDGHIRIYNAYDTPVEFDPNHEYQAGLLDALNIFVDSQKENLKSKYHRREFESGHFWRQYSSRFDPKKRADQTLLENLKFMRRELLAKLSLGISSEMASKIVHSLLGRAIFIKYLEDRKDFSGKNVFPDKFFANYWTGATCFTDVLSNKEATYKLFEYLNDKFNGDIFPIDDTEKRYIQFPHLDLLKSFLTPECVKHRETTLKII